MAVLNLGTVKTIFLRCCGRPGELFPEAARQRATVLQVFHSTKRQ